MIAHKTPAPRLPLTDSQKTFVEENLGLAWFAANNICPPIGLSKEEWESDCYLVLCEAVKSYSESDKQGKFSTYYLRAINYWRINSNDYSKRPSRDVRRTVGIGDFQFELTSGISELDRISEMEQAAEELGRFIDSLPFQDWRKAIRLKADGLDNQEIGDAICRSKDAAKKLCDRGISWLRSKAVLV